MPVALRAVPLIAAAAIPVGDVDALLPNWILSTPFVIPLTPLQFFWFLAASAFEFLLRPSPANFFTTPVTGLLELDDELPDLLSLPLPAVDAAFALDAMAAADAAAAAAAAWAHLYASFGQLW